MQKLKDLKQFLSALKDWKAEVDRALQDAAENEARAKALREKTAPKDALVLDLAAYRAMRASA